ncbi:MAG: hypothetical protein Kow006_18380 [Gammaproteobacteria bacterium]
MSDLSTTVRDFAQNTLGCGCPEEVFATVQRERRSDPRWGDLQRIDIGKRLLLYLVDLPMPVPGEEELVALLDRGRRDRDTNGFNRFRLVLFGEMDGKRSGDLNRLAESRFPGDEKVHLHLLHPSAHPLRP